MFFHEYIRYVLDILLYVLLEENWRIEGIK